MKKVLFFVVCMAFFVAAKAQISFGPKAGINVASIVGKGEVNGYKPKAGLYIGGQFSLPLNDQLSIQPEVYFSMQGGIWKEKGEDAGRSKMSYINIPVLAKYTHTSGFFAETGPQLGILLSAYDIWDDGYKDNVKAYVKKVDFSWGIGAGYQTRYGVGVNARYNMGISKYYEKERNSVFQVGLFYNLNRHFGIRGK
ncbi:MAG: PorT family protein [Chitinophagaceae bacterium]|nr:PorT family protein [Chitinophagaceae bacterium]